MASEILVIPVPAPPALGPEQRPADRKVIPADRLAVPLPKVFNLPAQTARLGLIPHLLGAMPGIPCGLDPAVGGRPCAQNRKQSCKPTPPFPIMSPDPLAAAMAAT